MVINQIGNGLSSSPHNTDGAHAMVRFPHVRIGDDVRAQEQLLREQFGIEELQLVVGGSMGAQETCEWAVRFPEKVKRAAPIAGTAKNTPHDFIFTETLKEAITSDPEFGDGWYEESTDVRDGLARHARIWSVLGFSTEFWKGEQWRPWASRRRTTSRPDSWTPTFSRWTPTTCCAWRGSGSAGT